MQRYFIKNDKITNDKAIIEDQDFHHIKNVMRMKVKDHLVICDDNKHCFEAKIAAFYDRHCEVLLIEEITNSNSNCHIDIAQALIKKDAFELVIQKATELGAENIIPLHTKHSIIKLDHKKMEAKRKRWNTIAKEASEQSERNSKSIVQEPHQLDNLPFESYDYVIVMHARGENPNLRHDMVQHNQKILVLIGPEGGFSDKEIAYLDTITNVHFFTIPNRILRSETASLYMLSVLGYLSEKGD